MPKTKTKTFEQAMERLNQIVSLLERGETELEESVALFKEGTELAAFCNRQLNEAEQKVSMLRVDENGEVFEAPFSGEENE